MISPIFELTGEQLKQPKLLFSCFWNTRWIENDSVKYSIFDASDRDGNFNANGYGLMKWGKYLEKKMVQTTSTAHLQSFASYSPDQKSMFVYLINKSGNAITVNPQVINHTVKRIKQAWELTGTGPDDTNPIWKMSESQAENAKQTVNGTSIKVIEYQLK